jgi:hypothetical protein
MRVKSEYRDRDRVQVAVLDALVDRGGEGMTVFELRSRVGADIDDIETALAALKEDDLVRAEDGGDRTLIVPADRVIPDPEPEEPDPSVLDRLRERLPF